MKHTTLWLTESVFNNVSTGLAKPHISLIRENNHVYLLSNEVGPTIEMIDLRLPSHLKWAKTNICAQTETDYGQYFAWGGISTTHWLAI